jgi:hypothetical protein
MLGACSLIRAFAEELNELLSRLHARDRSTVRHCAKSLALRSCASLKPLTEHSGAPALPDAEAQYSQDACALHKPPFQYVMTPGQHLVALQVAAEVWAIVAAADTRE